MSSHTARRVNSSDPPRGIASAAVVTGTHRSGASIVVPWKPSRATPTTRYG